MMKSMVRGATGVSMMALSFAALSAARAQTPPSANPATSAVADDANSASDIVVTGARGFRERLLDVPITISTLSGQDLERQGIDDLADVAEKTVGFAYEGFTGPLAQPTIRGQTNLRTQSPVLNVATYLDGIYLQRGYLIDQALLDLDRIEIIKGPQSALYGRNSFAGVINLTTLKPDLDRFTGRVSGTIGTDKRYDVKGTISVPIIPGKLAILGSAAYSTFDGTWKNYYALANAKGANDFTRGNAGGYRKQSYQAALKGEFGAIKLDGLYIHTTRTIEQVPTVTYASAAANYPFNSLNCSPVTIVGSTPATQNRLYCGELKPRVTLQPGETRPAGTVDVDPRSYGLKGPTDVGSAKVEFAPEGPLSAFAQFGYTYAKISARGSGGRDPSYPNPLATPGLNTTFDASGSGSSFRSYSGEFRTTYKTEQVRLFAGAAYSRTSDILANGNEFGPINSLDLPNTLISEFPIGPGLPFPANVYQRGTYQKRVEDIYSFYGFLELKPVDKLVVSVEGRYTMEDQQVFDFLVRNGPAGSPGFNIQALATPFRKRNENYFTPRGSITYKITPNNNVYAAVARGYKAGGFNGVTPTAPLTGGVPFAGQESYDAETNWTYEVGSKNRFSEIGLTINLSAYYTNWRNLQSNAARLLASGQLPPQNSAAFTVTGNIGSVHVKGAEIEGNWRMMKGVTLDFGVSYNQSRYTNASFSRRIGIAGNCDGKVCSNANPLPIGGNQLERVPKVDSLLGLSFDTTFANGWKGFVRGDATYQTKQFVDEANLAWVPSRTLANFAAGIDIGQISFNAWVKNAFDKKYVTSSLFLIGTGGAGTASYTAILGDRRTAGLTGTLKF